ncbi:MAG: hypothetical protein HKN28_02985 [Alphaproteobacteria bacterium]|nr:hypothetical protein [Alphaproteobacteria bacterium]
MVAEYRRLLFSSSELESAIVAFNREKSRKLPVGDIAVIEIVDEPNLRARIRIGNAYDSSQDQEVDLEAEYLVAAMLYHCRQQQIPVPKSPKKIVKRSDQGVEMSFSINADSDLAQEQTQ